MQLPRSGVLLLLPLIGCATQDAPDHPRPALPLPAEVDHRYALPGPVVEEYLVELNPKARISKGRLRCGDERPDFHLILPEKTPAPFLLCLPILAGGRDLMWYVAESMAARGYAVAWGQRVKSALKTDQTVADVETLFRRSIVHNRAVLRWAEQQTWCRHQETGLLGISTGGILGGTLLALEPRLSGGVLILAGGDLPDLLQNSSENRIVRWCEHRRTEDGSDAFADRLRLDLLSDPARVAPFVATERVFLVAAGLDTVVPSRNRDLLWEAFGRPTRLRLPLLSHYSAILGIQSVLARADEFLGRRRRILDQARQPAQQP